VSAFGPFLTELDGTAVLKGSRDPLGVQQIWTKLGRRVIGNLTTVSNSVRDFTALLIGLYLAEAAASGTAAAQLPFFLRWEQLAGYARGHVNADWRFRGTERVRTNVQTSNTQILSTVGKGPILSDQPTYGLWGLYTVPSRLSGLLEADAPRLTPAARDFVERQYLPKLAINSQGLRPLLTLLQKDPGTLRLDGNPLVTAVARVLDRKKFSKAEKAFYREHLLEGGPDDSTQGIQRTLERAMNESFQRSDFEWRPGEVRSLMARARPLGELGEELADRLQQILDCEAVIAPISRLFGYLLGKRGARLDAIARELRDTWGIGASSMDDQAFAALRPHLPTTEAGTADQWIRIASLAREGAYVDLVQEMVAVNRAVMAARGGAAWAEITDGALRVHFQEENGRLPAGEELPDQWRHPYFLDSLREVAMPLRDA
jgi:hypothetical protein